MIKLKSKFNHCCPSVDRWHAQSQAGLGLQPELVCQSRDLSALHETDQRHQGRGARATEAQNQHSGYSVCRPACFFFGFKHQTSLPMDLQLQEQLPKKDSYTFRKRKDLLAKNARQSDFRRAGSPTTQVLKGKQTNKKRTRFSSLCLSLHIK